MKFKPGDKVQVKFPHPDVEMNKIYTVKDYSSKYKNLINLVENR